MNDLIYDNYWKITQYSISNHILTVSGWSIIPKENASINVYADGVPATTIATYRDNSCDQLFDFLPEIMSSGFTARFFIKKNFNGYIKIEISYENYTTTVNAPLLPRYLLIGDSLDPIPSDEQLRRIAGSTANALNYWNVGYTEAKRLIWIAQKHGGDLVKQSFNILDWGCGCGRVTRQLINLTNKSSRILGIDIDEQNIAWCQKFISAEFMKVSLYPPTHLTDASYDIVVASSVASHLKRDILNQWLNELSRVLRPNGIIILSFLGSESAHLHLKNNPEIMTDFLNQNYNDVMECLDLQGVISDDSYYRNTFYNNDQFATTETNLTREAVYLSIAQGFQHYAVLRKNTNTR